MTGVRCTSDVLEAFFWRGGGREVWRNKVAMGDFPFSFLLSHNDSKLPNQEMNGASLGSSTR